MLEFVYIMLVQLLFINDQRLHKPKKMQPPCYECKFQYFANHLSLLQIIQDSLFSSFKFLQTSVVSINN